MPLYQNFELTALVGVVPHYLSDYLRLVVLSAAILPHLGMSAWAKDFSSNSISQNESLVVQVNPSLNDSIPAEQDLTPRNPDPLPELTPQQPSSTIDDLLRRIDVPPGPDDVIVPDDGATLCVQGFQVVGSTVFSEEVLNNVIKTAFETAGIIPSADCAIGQLTFSQIVIASSAVTQLYVEQRYVTSGAIIPADSRFTDGVVTVQVLEGRLEDIQVSGTEQLQAGYVSSRLGIAAEPPLNLFKLRRGLQLLQLDPLIDTIRADLQAGTQPGTNLLVVEVVEADSFDMTIGLDNNRSPSVGSFRRRLNLQENNLLGFGDSLYLGYANTNGSNEVSGRYTVPISPYNTTLEVAANVSDNEVIEDPFEVLDISSDSSNYRLTLTHPVVQTPTNQFDLGLSLSRQFSQTELGLDNIGPFPLSAGADNDGRTITSALRFSQTWTQRSTKEVIALRSQFNLGLGNFLDGTTNSDPDSPDNTFLTWQGQGQWVRRLGEESLLLLRGNIQLADDDLLSAEQLGSGGQATVRGYRQEETLTDNGIQASVEARFPILRVPKVKGALQIAPFLDVGHGWNIGGDNPDPNTLVGVGAGLIWMQPNLDARIDWGIPLTSGSEEGDSLQENGFYFLLNYSFF